MVGECVYNMKDIFVYGTLLNDEVLENILGHIPTKCSAQLHGYKRVKVLGEKYPAILPDENSKVDGVILIELSATDLKYLDEYEGMHYERQSVLVSAVTSVSGDLNQPCTTYVFRPEYYNLLASEAWSNESFRENHLQRFLREIKES
jgi:gamma-glutamylcyclotransferase (GGCT)/AIG2-like uncharacterized protein YtfP